MGLGQGYCALGSGFVRFVGHCLWNHCILCETALLDIVTLLGTLSRLGITNGTSLSTWKKPWKRVPKVTSGWFSAGRDASQCWQDTKLPGQDVSRREQDGGGSQSHPAHLLEVSFRQ